VTAATRLRRGGPGWPPALEHLGAAAPEALWVRSGAPLEELTRPPSVAVVGARRCSAAAERFARDLAAGLAAADVAIISGLALGIDGAAHAGALDGGGRTVAVLGCGIDRLYPARHAALGERVVAVGAVISEWGPGVEPAPWRFPVRNRLIAALASATVVVEATRRSGALITADHALALGRDVLAVPGPAWSVLGEGVNDLLRAGAMPVTGLDDVLDALGLPAATTPVQTGPAPDLGPEAEAVLARLRREPARPNELALTLGMDASAVTMALAELELAGFVVREAGDRLSAVAPGVSPRAR
jgi:DNA processing protein